MSRLGHCDDCGKAARVLCYSRGRTVCEPCFESSSAPAADPLEVWRETFEAGELVSAGEQLGFWLDAGAYQGSGETLIDDAADAAER